jgi:hypothetical protein
MHVPRGGCAAGPASGYRHTRLRLLRALFGLLFFARGLVALFDPEDAFAVADILGFLFLSSPYRGSSSRQVAGCAGRGSPAAS